MIDAEKVKIMTKLAAFEEKEKRDALRITEYYQTDFVRIRMLKAFVLVTIGYAIILMIMALVQMDYLLQNIIGLDYETLIKKITGGYIILLLIYLSGALIGSVITYRKAKKKVKKYDGYLHELRKWYRDKEQK